MNTIEYKGMVFEGNGRFYHCDDLPGVIVERVANHWAASYHDHTSDQYICTAMESTHHSTLDALSVKMKACISEMQAAIKALSA